MAKRYKETKNLSFNHQSTICTLCKRWKGGFTSKDEFVCKYNRDHKGLINGLVKNHLQNFKCKYYKRLAEVNTYRFNWKYYETISKNQEKYVDYKQGKFQVKIINKKEN